MYRYSYGKALIILVSIIYLLAFIGIIFIGAKTRRLNFLI